MDCIKCKTAIPDGALYCPWCGKKQTPEKRKALKRANGTGTVYKLSGRRRKPWVAAKNKVIIGYYERKTDALEALEALHGQALDVRYNMTFAQVYEAWSKAHFKSVQDKSIKGYEGAYKIFAPLYNRKFRELRASDFQEVIDQYRGKSRSTVSKYKILLTQMSQWAVKEEICNVNYAAFVALPKAQKKIKTTFSDNEIAILAADDTETAKIILMLIYTGMRIGELFALRLEDYHGDYVVGGEKTEAGELRTIPIRPEGRKYFAYFAEQADGETLLSGYIGQHDPNNFRRRDYYPLLEKLGIERKEPHATRRTFASWAVKEQVQPEVLQKVLGHADYSTTMKYYAELDAETLVGEIESH